MNMPFIDTKLFFWDIKSNQKEKTIVKIEDLQQKQFGPYINEDIFVYTIKEDLSKTPLLRKFLKGYILDNEPPVDINNDPIKDRKIRSNILKAKNVRPAYIPPVTDSDKTIWNRVKGITAKKIQAKSQYEQAMLPFYEVHPMIKKLNKKRDVVEIELGKATTGFNKYVNTKQISTIVKAFAKQNYAYAFTNTFDLVKNGVHSEMKINNPQKEISDLYKKELKRILIVEKLQELIKTQKITGEEVYKKIVKSLSLINHSIK